MINVSNAFKNELYLDRRNYLEYAEITLSDETKLNLTNKDFWQGGMSLDDAVSGNDAFEIGAAIVNSCSLTIENLDDRFSEYDFLNAKVVIYVGLNLPDGTTEKIRKGTYTVNEPKYNGATISLNCQDNMAKFDRPYSESELTYPATLGSIVQNACSTCGVTLQTPTFPHSDFVVQTRPTDEAITFREVISWAAQIAGCFCRCDVQGRLELKWYNQQLLEKHGYDGGVFDKVSTTKYTTGDNVDGGLFNPWNTGGVADGGTFKEMEGIHHIYSHYSAPVISTDDVVITGVRVLEKAKEQDEETGSEKDAIITYQSGSDGYVVSIEDNELIQGRTGLEISNWLGKQLIGFRFRKASLSHASDPTIEAGDIALVTDRKQNTYPIIISSTRFSTGSAQSTESSAETPARNSAARFSAQTKNYVEYRKDIEKERTEREKAQDELKERIDSSSGLYSTEETQPDGSKIFYMHDKPTLEESMIVWKMTAEAWGVSTDGGGTYNAGMTVDGDTIVRILTAVGVNADWIKAGAFRIEKDGKVIFLADADTKQVKIVADEFSLSSGETIGSIAESAVNDFISKTYDPEIAEIQKQLDGQIESFYYDYAPTLTNLPASGWTTEADKQKHEGDLFYNRTTGYAYRFFKDGTTWKWQMIQDTDITKAIAQASAAQDTADHKRRVFVSTPTPPYDIGDLWVQGENGDIMRCQTARPSGSYVSSDWIKASKYTDDSALKTFINDTYTVKINELETQADKKAETWYQSSDPSTAWDTLTLKSEHVGDLWYNSTKDVQKYYRWNGTTWQELTSTPPDAVFDQIDGKAQIFISTPTVPYHVGDLWFDSTTSDIMTCIKTRTSGSYTASEWEKRNKYTDDTELTNFIKDTYEKEISALKQQADKKAETWYQSADPSKSWTTAESKSEHVGDMWYCTGSTDTTHYQKFWRWNGSNWQEMTTTPPEEVFDKIDGKAQIFISTPVPPYSKGDLWFQDSKSDIMTCKNTRTSGSFISTDWEKRNKYIDQSAADKAASDAVEGQTQDDIFNKLTDNGKTKGIILKNGELYVNATYINTGIFKVSKDGKTMFSVNIDTGDVEIVAKSFSLSSGATIDSIAEGKANGALKSAKTYADTAASNAVKAQTQEDIFNKLTNNGEEQGIYIENEKVYINADYVQSGTFSAARIKGGTLVLGGSSNTNGILQILNASGREIGRWDNSGIIISAGSIKSSNYSLASGQHFANAGTMFDLANGAFYSKNFALDSSGTAYFRGNLDGANGSFSGTITSSTISGGTVTSSNEEYSVVFTNGSLSLRSGYMEIGYLKVTNGELSYAVSDPDEEVAPLYSDQPVLAGSSILALAIGSNILQELSGYMTNFYSYVTVMGSLNVKGGKYRSVKTENYSERLLSSYEMPSPMFGDIGEAFTDENGECYIYLDDIFSETVSAQIEYQVFLQKEGPGDIWIAEKTPQYFVVQGTENLKFAWEIKAKQKGYEYERLEENPGASDMEPDYEQQYMNEIEELIKKQEEIYYETA